MAPLCAHIRASDLPLCYASDVVHAVPWFPITRQQERDLVAHIRLQSSFPDAMSMYAEQPAWFGYPRPPPRAGAGAGARGPPLSARLDAACIAQLVNDFDSPGPGQFGHSGSEILPMGYSYGFDWGAQAVLNESRVSGGDAWVRRNVSCGGVIHVRLPAILGMYVPHVPFQVVVAQRAFGGRPVGTGRTSSPREVGPHVERAAVLAQVGAWSKLKPIGGGHPSLLAEWCEGGSCTSPIAEARGAVLGHLKALWALRDGIELTLSVTTVA